MLEQGFPDNVSASWQGILVPAGTPRPIVEKLHAATLRAMGNPQLLKRVWRSRRDCRNEQDA